MSGLESASLTELAVLAPSNGAPAEVPGIKNTFNLFGEDGFTFADFIDIINPLQHIPLLSTLYRHLTGDTIDRGSRVLGDTLFGGPIGTVASLVNVFVEENTGKDLGEHALALFTDETPVSETAVAQGGVSEDRFETAAGGAGGGVSEPLSSSTEAIVATVQANRFAVASVTPPRRSEPLAPSLVLGPVRVQTVPTATRQVASATTQLRHGEHQADAFSTLRYRAALHDTDADKARKSKAPVAGATATTQLRHGEHQADAFSTLRYQAALHDTDKDRKSKGTVAGATAIQGGWFTDTMLSGLVKYKAAVQQAKPTPGHAVDLSN